MSELLERLRELGKYLPTAADAVNVIDTLIAERDAARAERDRHLAQARELEEGLRTLIVERDQERESCARIADSMATGIGIDTAKTIARMIRARAALSERQDSGGGTANPGPTECR